MECPRGSEVRESSHEVKTMAKALEWTSKVCESDLPITIEQQVAKGGRARVKIWASNGDLIETKG